MKCSYFLHSDCKSCDLLDKGYEETLRFKEGDLKKKFHGYDFFFKSSIGLNNDAIHSRNKAKFAAFMIDEQLTFGLYLHDGTPRELENCPLHSEGINKLLSEIRKILNTYKIIPYDLKNKKGELKYVLISKNDTDEFLLRFVLRSKESLDRLKKATVDILGLAIKVRVITANIQPIHQAILEGDEEIILTANTVIYHQFDEFKLALGAKSFFQVTSEISRKLYNAVADSIALDLPCSLIDLYCGVGAFSFYASRHCSNVVGVEISTEAISCAKNSAQMNLRQIQFYAMDVEDYFKKYPDNYEAVIVNPPRRGLNSSIIKTLKEIDAQFIYYSSCNAETLARDFYELKEKYKIQSLQIFDMFPYTSHYETLMCLVKK